MTNQQTPRSERELAAAQYRAARSNLLVMIGLTVLNIVLLFVGSDSMMLFSATVPYFAVGIGILSGMPTLQTVGCVLAAIFVIVYFACWMGSKKHYGWMIAAFILFCLDTVALVLMYVSSGDFSGVLDLIIHIAVLYYLFNGVKYGAKLKKLPPEPQPAESTEEDVPAAEIPCHNSSPLRRADTEVKHRVLLEADTCGVHVCYRRVKRINELVINGYVYDDVEMLIEAAHALNATINGHVIQVGYDGASFSYLRVDGETVQKKLRLF